MNWLRSKKTIAVHSGNFHADDVFAVATLSLFLNEKLKIIRVRNKEEYYKADYVLDVGGEYDPLRNKFDHHQEGGAGKRENGIPYATFGLVWKQFGEKITGSIEAKNIIDKKLVQVIDAADNAFDLSTPVIKGVLDYSLRDYMIYMTISCKNDKEKDKVFFEMVDFAKKILAMEIQLAKDFVKGKSHIISAYNVAGDKRIIILNEDYSSWNEVLSDYPEPLFLVKPASEIKSWKVYCIRNKGDKFKNRLDLPESWAGKKDGELVKVTDVADAIYCHHGRYMAIAKTKEGAIKLAQLAIKELNT